MPPKKSSSDMSVKPRFGRPGNTLKMGIIGLPNVGKSTLFNCLTKLNVPASNYPFCTIEPNIAQVSVPDERFHQLVEAYKPKTIVQATLKIVDIAGLVRNAHKGEGLGNQFLSHIREVDGLFHVVRTFEDPDVAHTEMDIEPIRDLEIIRDELIFKDLEYLDKRLAEVEVKITKQNDKKFIPEQQCIIKAKDVLNNKKWIKDTQWTFAEIELLNDMQLLTAKQVVYLVNLSEEDFKRKKNKWLLKIKEWIGQNIPGEMIPFSAGYESKLQEQSQEEQQNQKPQQGEEKKQEEKKVQSQDQHSMINKIIRAGYKTLDLVNFFTTLSNEIKAWTVREGCLAPQAAGAIHTDMEKGFICADIMKYDDWIKYGSETAVKAEGKFLQKGKDYAIQDGDIVQFKFNPPQANKKK